MLQEKQIDELLKRGVEKIYPSNGFLESKLKSRNSILKIYLGIDPTGPDLHLGHAIQLIKLKQFQNLGHKIILLIGDFTARIGDPTDKNAVRKKLTAEEIKTNLKGYKKQASKILNFTGDNPVEIKFNSKWLAKMSFEDVLGIASNFTVQQMLSRDMFERRFYGQVWCSQCRKYFVPKPGFNLAAVIDENTIQYTHPFKKIHCTSCNKEIDLEEVKKFMPTFTHPGIVPPKPISLHEFFYPLMQGYDSVAMDVDGEVGGNDQTFNMLVGRDLLGIIKNKEKFVITTKLLTDPSGSKMGKTTGNMIRLNDSAKDMYGKVMSWPDSMIALGFELCAGVSFEDAKDVRIEIEKSNNPMQYKMRLAREIVKFYYSEDMALVADAEFKRVFQEDEVPQDAIEYGVSGKSRVDLMSILTDTGACSSRNEARRLITQGAIKLNGEKITDIDAQIEIRHGSTLKVGKRKFIKLKAL